LITPQTRAVGCSALFGDSNVVYPPQPELSPLGPVLELAVGLADQLLEVHLHIVQWDHLTLPVGSSAAHQSRRGQSWV